MDILQIAQAVSTGGAAVAVIITVMKFLKHLREKDEAQRVERTQIHQMITEERRQWADERCSAIDERKDTIRLIGNHMQHQTEALAAVVTKLSGLKCVTPNAGDDRPANPEPRTPNPDR